MKKFLLLCGVAAITATSVVNYVKAGPVTQDFNVGVKLINALDNLYKIQDLNFGNVLAYGAPYAGASVTLAPDGTVSGSATQYGGEQVAIVIANINVGSEADITEIYDITVSGDDKLYDGTGDGKKLCGHVSDWKHDTFHHNFDGTDQWNQGFHIGATFTLPSSAEWETSAAAATGAGDISCTGEATATLIYVGN